MDEMHADEVTAWGVFNDGEHVSLRLMCAGKGVELFMHHSLVERFRSALLDAGRHAQELRQGSQQQPGIQLPVVRGVSFGRDLGDRSMHILSLDFQDQHGQPGSHQVWISHQNLVELADQIRSYVGRSAPSDQQGPPH